MKQKYFSNCSTSQNRTKERQRDTICLVRRQLNECLWCVCCVCGRTWLQCVFSPVRCVGWPCWASVYTWWWTSEWPSSLRPWRASTRPTCCWSAASSSRAFPSWASWALWRRTAVSSWRYGTHGTPDPSPYASPLTLSLSVLGDFDET